jgi:hypothetical protein
MKFPLLRVKSSTPIGKLTTGRVVRENVLQIANRGVSEERPVSAGPRVVVLGRGHEKATRRYCRASHASASSNEKEYS